MHFHYTWVQQEVLHKTKELCSSRTILAEICLFVPIRRILHLNLYVRYGKLLHASSWLSQDKHFSLNWRPYLALTVTTLVLSTQPLPTLLMTLAGGSLHSLNRFIISGRWRAWCLLLGWKTDGRDTATHLLYYCTLYQIDHFPNIWR